VNKKSHRRGSAQEDHIPASLQGILSSFANCFTRPSFENFVTLMVGWLLCSGRHTISRVIQAAGRLATGKHHSSYYRFLSRGRWHADHLGRVAFNLLLHFMPKEVTALVDDTLCHRSGPHIFGGAMHHDACRSTYGRGSAAGGKVSFSFGQNWVVLAVWVPFPWSEDRGWAVPVLLRLYRSPKRCPKDQYRKRTELASDLVQILGGWLPPGRTLHLVGDAEYACKNVVLQLPKEVTFTGPMSMKAAVFGAVGKKHSGRGRPRVKGKRLLSPKQLADSRSRTWTKLQVVIYGDEVTIQVKWQICMWYTVAGPRLVRMVVTRDPRGIIDDRAYFCTDPGLEVEDVLVHFARRWQIEVAFRDAKQTMGLEDPQNGWWRRKSSDKAPRKRPGPNPRGRRGELAARHTLPLVFTAYALVIVWYLKHGNPDRDVQRVRTEAPWYRDKTTPSFTDMLAAVRREIWARRISRYPSLRPVRKKILDLLPGWLLAA